jgi:N-acetylmuramoyl-L-alanine amidase
VSSGAYNAEDILLAARVAYFEAGRTEEGYRAVLCVIVNRVEAGKWPDTVYDVVYQKSQFTVVGRSDFLTKTIPDDVIGYADDVFNGGNRLIPSNVMSFRSERTDKTWGDRTFYGTYGGNDFYG